MICLCDVVIKLYNLSFLFFSSLQGHVMQVMSHCTTTDTAHG